MPRCWVGPPRWRSAYAAWQNARQELEHWDEIASQFHEQEKRRLPFLEEIHTEKAKLEQEQKIIARAVVGR